MKREDLPADRVANATRKQLNREGYVEELEPGVLQVISISGRRLRWIRVFGTNLYRLASVEEAA
jgi:hypothetical protein